LTSVHLFSTLLFVQVEADMDATKQHYHSPNGADDAKEALTDRQRAVLEFISASIEERGYPPTLREIGEHMGIRSTNGVNDHLKALEKKGYLEREDLKSRALRPISLDGAGPTGNLVEVPILGRVAAGEPILAIEQAEDTVKVDRFFLGPSREVFALKVKGDSMIEAGIYDGDYIFVKKQLAANRGDMVVAMINDEATVKYFHPEGDQIVFKPANHRLSPIVVRKRDWKSVNLIGLVVGVYRRL
jgi:repressor LexA